MKIEVGDHLIPWLEERLGEGFKGAKAIGCTYNGEITAVFAFTNFRSDHGVPVSIEINLAIDNPRVLRPATVGVVLSYPFVQLGCRRATVLVREDNERSLRLAQGLGFKIEGECRDATADGKSMILLGLTRDEYMNSKFAPRGER